MPDPLPSVILPEAMPSTAAQRRAGVLLARAGPALAGLGLLAGGLAAVLVPLGGWRPLIVVPLLLVLAAGLAPALRSVPARPAPVWTVAGIAGLSVVHAVWAAATHAQHVVLRRDAGSYALYTQWIADHHGLQIPSRIEAFGGAAALADPAFRLASPAFFFVGDGPGTTGGGEIVPQFLIGAPAVFSFGWWVHGWGGLFVVPAVVSGCALLALGSLAARLFGPRWAVPVVATLAVCQPVLHAARSTYSEPLALLVVAAAAALLVDAVRTGSGPLGWAAGLGFGLVGLVRVDAVREVALLLPVAAVLALRRHPAARGIGLGAPAGTALAAVPAVLLSWPYLDGVRASLLPLLAGAVLLGLLSLAAVLVLRPRVALEPFADQGIQPRGPWPALATGAVLLVGLGLAARPLVMVTRQSAADPGSRVVAGLQLRQGLPVDGGRTYAEHSVTWLSWYLGPLTLLAALLLFAALAGRAVRWWSSGSSRVPPWLAPAVVGFGSAVLTLYRPGITPDHPWADRRMVPMVLPTVVIAAGAALAWVGRTARRRWSAPVLAGAIIVGVAAMLVPSLLATLPVAGAAARTELGEPGAVAAVCAALHPDDAVLALDSRAANEWPQVIRGVCGVPAASIKVASADAAPAAVRRISARIVAAGHRPVLLAGSTDGTAIVTALGESATPVVDLTTHEDQRYLTRRPDGVDPLAVQVWLARP